MSVKGAREENSGYFKVFSYNVAMFQQNFTQNRPKPRLCQTCRSRTVTFWRVPMSSYLKLIRERRRRERRKFEDFEETSLKVISNELFAGEACTPSNQSTSIHPVRVLEGVTTSRGSYTPSRFSAPSRRMYLTRCPVLKGVTSMHCLEIRVCHHRNSFWCAKITSPWLDAHRLELVTSPPQPTSTSLLSSIFEKKIQCALEDVTVYKHSQCTFHKRVFQTMNVVSRTSLFCKVKSRFPDRTKSR